MTTELSIIIITNDNRKIAPKNILRFYIRMYCVVNKISTLPIAVILYLSSVEARLLSTYNAGGWGAITNFPRHQGELHLLCGGRCVCVPERSRGLRSRETSGGLLLTPCQRVSCGLKSILAGKGSELFCRSFSRPSAMRGS